MSPGDWTANLGAYAVQVAAVVVVGAALPRVCRLRAPGPQLVWWRLLLLAALASPFLQPWRAATADEGGTLGTVVARTIAAPRPAFPWAVSALILTGAGAAFRLFRLGLGLARLRRWRLAARPYRDDAVAEAERCAGTSARLYLTSSVAVPATYGTFRPVVLLPDRVVTLPWPRRRDVLVHELLHVRRRDWTSAMVEELAGTLMWFHPAVSWLLGRIRLAREQVVDAAVVSRTGDRREYLETLLAFAAAGSRSLPAAPLFERPHLGSRVDALMEEDTMSRSQVAAVLAASALVIGATAVQATAAWPLRTMAAAAAAERKVISKLPPPYPSEAKKNGIQGVVRLDVLITAAGEVTDVKVLEGPAELREAATAAVRQWKYEPGKVDTRATLVIHYRLSARKEGDRS